MSDFLEGVGKNLQKSCELYDSELYKGLGFAHFSI